MSIDKKALVPSEGGQPAASDAPKSHVPSVMVPDAAYLIRGELSQEGFDLVMTLPDGRQHTVHDYFSFQPPPTLFSASGAGLSPTMVKSFLVRPFDGDVLFAGPATAPGVLVEIGTVTVLVGQVTVRRLDGSEAQLAKGDKLYKGDVITTGAGSFVKAEMLDGTRFQLGQSGEAALDNFEFNEAQNVGRFEASVRVGGFYYKSGKIGELSSSQTTAHTTLRTPTSIIGVRGSELEGSVDASGNTIVVHRSGVLEISDINGENSVILDQPGNTATVVLDGTPLFTVEPPPEAQQALEASLPPADASSNDEEGEAEAEDEGNEEEGDESSADAEEVSEEDAEETESDESAEELTEEEPTEEEAAEEEAAEEEDSADDTGTETTEDA
ncbi:MAG: FecR family protein, partial [Pseudomonadales bacterium]